MKQSTRAALLSAFIFPGLGHIYLKKYVAAVLLAGSTLAGIYYIISTVIEKAYEITEQIQRGEVSLDSTEIAELLSQQSAADVQMMNAMTIVVVICWLIGIVDSYRVGHLRDQSDSRSIDNQ